MIPFGMALLPLCAPVWGREGGNGAPAAHAAPDWTALRMAMVATQLERRGVRAPAVLDAMRHVPRHEFVPDTVRDQAYDDHPLPIGFDQTISQPYIVAAMTEALELGPDDTVLEIGAGSGYQSAVLARLARTVCSIEIVPELAARATDILARLNCNNVTVRTGDGYAGWPGHTPFNAIIVTCAPDAIPAPLPLQLAEGGRMVIPVGGAWHQELVRVRKLHGTLAREHLMGVRFVPMTGTALSPARQ